MIDTTTRQADAITPEFAAEAQELISHYPVSKRSASLPLLHLWQNHFGFIDDTGIEWIAVQLDLTPVNILELVTFYPWFRREQAGKTQSGTGNGDARAGIRPRHTNQINQLIGPM